jgi:predicted MFS family arabinose efflux permease
LTMRTTASAISSAWVVTGGAIASHSSGDIAARERCTIGVSTQSGQMQLTYGLGALVGGVLQSRASMLVIWLPLISLVAVVVNAFVRDGREPRAPERPGDDRETRNKVSELVGVP